MEIKINDQDLFYKIDDEEHCNEEKILAILLLEGHLFLNDTEIEKDVYNVVAYVNANDFLMWGCADAEHISTSELGEFYKMSRQQWGDVKWVCKKRNMQPQYAIARDIKKTGHWDEIFENLPKNEYDPK